MFCQSCLTTTRAVIEDLRFTHPGTKSSKTLHKSLIEFHQSVATKCWICRQLWNSLLERDDDESTPAEPLYMDPKTLFRWHNSLVKLKILVKSHYLVLDLTIYQLPKRKITPSRCSTFILTPKPRYTEARPSYLGEEVFEDDALAIRKPWMWKHWLRICSQSHQKCRALDREPKQIVPDRLLELSTKDGGMSFEWKLVLSTGFKNISYLTLSHCWGASQHKVLKRDNYSARMEPTSAFKLPKTFQDAFYIAFKLNIRFIWIDSLCIIQDDEDDWLTQASKMGSIYEGASCNIAATWAPDGDGGCFTKKETRTISLNYPPGRTWEYYVHSDLLYYEDLMEARLNTRGWVTQERYLARRQLSFAKSQIYWECRELSASEQFPNGIPRTLIDLSPYNQAVPPVGKPTLDHSSTIERRAAWAGLVDFYSNCKFTRLSDKMVALSGLARNMSLMEEDTYLAGLWKKNIESQLCWVTDDDVRREDDRRRIQPYEAPTWSWASMNGPVRSDQRYYMEDVQHKSLAKVLDVSVHSKHESKLHSFTASSLILRGIAVRARPRLSKRRGFPVDDDNWILQCIDFGSLRIEVPVSIVWDENISDLDADMERRASLLAERESDLLCMLVNYDDCGDCRPWVSGLLLRQQQFPADKASYTRMGYFMTHDEKNLFGTLSARLAYIPSCPVVSSVDLQSTDPMRFICTVTIF